jgi:hypothetical protein
MNRAKSPKPHLHLSSGCISIAEVCRTENVLDIDEVRNG